MRCKIKAGKTKRVPLYPRRPTKTISTIAPIRVLVIAKLRVQHEVNSESHLQDLFRSEEPTSEAKTFFFKMRLFSLMKHVQSQKRLSHLLTGWRVQIDIVNSKRDLYLLYAC